MRHRPSRWTLAAFAFAVVAGFIAWLILGRGERRHRLADGREFSIVAVTYGTNHVLEEGPPWARLVARYGSRPMAYRFGYGSSGGYPSAVPSVMIWTRWSPSNSNSAPLYASVADAWGAETEPAYVSSSQTGSPKHDGTYAAWRFDNYPRHQKEFTLRFYEYDLFHVRVRGEGEVSVRNPVPTVSLRGSAPSAPVKATNGLLECILVSLHCGAPPRRPWTAKNIAPWVTAEFEFRENGELTTGWTVKRIEAFGVTGNHFVSDRLEVELDGARRVARFTGAFWRDEPHWRLIAEVTPARNFPPENLWTVRLPTGAFFHGTLTTNLQPEGRGLDHFRLTIGPATVALGGEGMPEKRVALLRANFTPATPNLYLDIARAADDQGRRLSIVGSRWPKSGFCEADIGLSASANFVDLTFAAHKSQSMEFRTRPTYASTNAPVNKP